MSLDLDFLAMLPLPDLNLHKRNSLFLPLFTIVNNNNVDSYMLHGLELLISNSGKGAGN